MKALFISVKPEFAHKIMVGKKTVELRKCMPKANKGDVVIVYSTSPEKAVIGICKIKAIIKSSPQNIWNNYKSDLGIGRKRYYEYYKGCLTAVAIVLEDIYKLKNTIPLQQYQYHFPSFTPPQTYKYVPRQALVKAFKELKTYYI